MDTEAALRAEIKATQDRLAMAETLANSVHDMQQPLVSLRSAMQRARAESDTKINSSLDYLNDVLRRNLTNLQTDATQEDSYTDVDLLDTVQPQKAHDIEDFEISIVFDRTLTMFRDEASANCLYIHVIPSNYMARGSPLVLMRKLSNLVSNAIKNTDEGSITLRCNDQDGHLLIEVCDTRKGISPEIMPQIQQRYQRAGCYEDLSLALANVHQLCDEYGIKLTFLQSLGKVPSPAF